MRDVEQFWRHAEPARQPRVRRGLVGGGRNVDERIERLHGGLEQGELEDIEFDEVKAAAACGGLGFDDRADLLVLLRDEVDPDAGAGGEVAEDLHVLDLFSGQQRDDEGDRGWFAGAAAARRQEKCSGQAAQSGYADRNGYVTCIVLAPASHCSPHWPSMDGIH